MHLSDSRPLLVQYGRRVNLLRPQVRLVVRDGRHRALESNSELRRDLLGPRNPPPRLRHANGPGPCLPGRQRRRHRAVCRGTGSQGQDCTPRQRLPGRYEFDEPHAFGQRAVDLLQQQRPKLVARIVWGLVEGLAEQHKSRDDDWPPVLVGRLCVMDRTNRWSNPVPVHAMSHPFVFDVQVSNFDDEAEFLEIDFTVSPGLCSAYAYSDPNAPADTRHSHAAPDDVRALEVLHLHHKIEDSNNLTMFFAMQKSLGRSRFIGAVQSTLYYELL